MFKREAQMTTMTLFKRKLLVDTGVARDRLERAGIAEGMPIVFADDGRPISVLNRWLRSLPTRGGRSPNTWVGYAKDSMVWQSHLDKRGVDLFAGRAALRDALADLYVRRRIDPPLEDRWGPATWNRFVAAIDNFYNWAVEEELTTSLPFSYSWARNPYTGQPVRRNRATERNARRHATIRWLGDEQHQLFRDVGMVGLLPDGTACQGFSGRNAARNAAFADLLRGSGVRVQEGSHLLIFELPELPTGSPLFVDLPLPPAICKGGIGRTTWLPLDALRRLHRYVGFERGVVAARSRWHPRDATVVTDADAKGGRVDGKRVRWAQLGPAERRRLVMPDGGSPLLMLTATGSPMTDWEEVFNAATARCRALDSSFPSKVHPHMFRHSFAIHALGWLQREAARIAIKNLKAGDTGVLAQYQKTFDPLIALRDLLGHASVTTTQVYLQLKDSSRLWVTLTMDDADGERCDEFGVP
jgi:site-specific recombinase XerD